MVISASSSAKQKYAPYDANPWSIHHRAASGSLAIRTSKPLSTKPFITIYLTIGQQGAILYYVTNLT